MPWFVITPLKVSPGRAPEAPQTWTAPAPDRVEQAPAPAPTPAAPAPAPRWMPNLPAYDPPPAPDPYRAPYHAPAAPPARQPERVEAPAPEPEPIEDPYSVPLPNEPGGENYYWREPYPGEKCIHPPICCPSRATPTARGDGAFIAVLAGGGLLAFGVFAIWWGG